MKKCWNSDPNNRPGISEVERSIREFYNSVYYGKNDEIDKQFNEAEKYKKANLLIVKNNQPIIHSQAIYTSRLLNPYTKDLDIDFIK